MAKLSIIIPVFNESKTIVEVLWKITDLELCHGFEKEIILVDDCSSDGSDQLIEDYIQKLPSGDSNIRLIRQVVNRGKGAAVRKGIEAATGEFLIPQDADLELDPNDINVLLHFAVTNNATVVYGSRFLGRTAINDMGVLQRVANLFLTRLSNALSGQQVTDMETCYKLIKTSVAKSLKLRENRFGFEPEITARLSKIKGLRIAEVPISYFPRNKAAGKKINWKDGVKAMYCIFRYNLF
ncbi:MAG: glycosyltransferase family 2 protein [Cryomorphaceae bacterium]|nr:MAG: glycosyltransferase family 2 protein [Cryomorphaceae bacterium]